MSILQICELAHSAHVELLHISTNSLTLAIFLIKVLVLIKLMQLLTSYCKTDVDITGKLVSAFKVRKKFSVKDSMPQSLCSRVVYKFTCADCNACYIRRTTRPICTHVCEPNVLDKGNFLNQQLRYLDLFLLLLLVLFIIFLFHLNNFCSQFSSQFFIFLISVVYKLDVPTGSCCHAHSL